MKPSNARPIERLALPVSLVEADPQTGIVEAIVTVFGVVINAREGKTVLMSRSFTKTLQERPDMIRVLDNHQKESALAAVGVPLEIREIGRGELPPQILARFPEATGGLYTRTQYLLNTPEGYGIFERIRTGALREYSIAFEALIEEWGDFQTSGGKVRARLVREVRLWEYGPVLWGANPATATIATHAWAGQEAHAIDLVRHLNAIAESFNKALPEEWRWLVFLYRIYDTHVIAANDAPDDTGLPYPFYKVNYTSEDDRFLWASPGDWRGGDVGFIPAAPEGVTEGSSAQAAAVAPETQNAGPGEVPPTLAVEEVRIALMTRATLLTRQLRRMQEGGQP